MSDTELKFGPEWMRQLSHGGGLAGSAAPPCQPSLPANKNKPAVAEHRYSKEKMLELCARMEAPPEHLLNDPAALCGDQDCTVPLAFTSLSQDEQRMWQRNINSDSALRFMANGNTGRGGGVSGGGGGGGGGGGLVASGSGALGGANSLGGVGGPGSRGRGGSMDRGRGRARGGPGQYYMRGLSYEEDGETGARGGGSRELAPPGIAMRRGGGFERSSSLSSGVGLSGGGSDGRSGLGAWGVPPNITSDHPSSQMSGSGYHASQNLDHSSATRGSLQGEDRGGASSPRKEQSRASTDNWRSRDLSSGAGDAAPVLQDHWRSSGSLGSSLAPRQQQDKWGAGRLSNSGGWRPRDAGEESAGGYTGGYSTYGASRGRGQQRSRQPWDNRRNWGDEDRLPEWATDLSHEPARGGSFDASGAFHSPAWSSADDDHGISNGFSVNSYSNSNHYSVSGGGGGYSHSSGNFASGGGSLIATAGGLRARHKSGSVGPGELLSPESSVSSDVSGLDSGVAGSAVKDSSSRGTSREKSGSSVLNGFHRSTISRTSSDALHATDPQKRLSEALEVHGDEGPGRPLMNGYGGDSRSDSRSSSHEGSNSPLSSEKVPSQGHLESSRSVPSMLDSPRSRTSCSEEKSSGVGGNASSTVQQVSEEGSADQQQQLRQPLGHLEHSKSEPAVPSGLRASSNSVRESESAGPGHSLSSQLLQPSPSLPSSKEEKLRDPELEHMELNADDLVAKLVDEEPKACDPVPNAPRRPINITPPAGFLPIPERPPADPHQWYYTDPQQEVQGPFSGLIMTSWYEGGYFGDDLLLRRDCDDKFAKLGDLKRVFGRVPFAPGPPVPPLKMSKLRDSQTPHDAEKEIIRKQAAEKEAFEQALQAYNLQKRIYDRQLEQRQAHVLSALSSLEGWDSLPPETQRNLFMQNILRLGNLPEPVAPTAPSFLLNSSPASAAAALSLLTLPQQVHHQLPQASTVASTDASSLQQQHGASSGVSNIATSLHLNTTLASASIAAAAASSSAAGVGVVQQLQNLPQHSMLAAASSNSSSNSNTPHLQHLSSSAIPEQQQPPLSLTRDPIRELVDQMSSVTTGQQQKSASPLTTLGVTDSPPVMPPNTAAMPTLAQPTPLHQLLLKLQSDANSNAVPTLPLLPQQLLSSSSLASGLQIPRSSSSSAAADAGLNSQLSTAADNSRATAALLGTPQQPPPQEDVIQSFMQQLTKMHLQQEQTSTQAATAAMSPAADAVASAAAAALMVATEAEQEQTEPAPVEEDKRRPNHAKKLLDEKKKADSRAKKDEENATNKKQEDRRKLLEEQKKKEQEEEQKKKALEAKRKEEEKKKKLKQQEDANRRQEEKRRQEEENKRKAEERRREQQLRKQQQQQQEEMRRMALEEERKRMNHVDQDELAETEVARLQQQQQAAWGNVAAAAAAPAANGAQRTPSLVQIQKVQLEKEKLERERWLKEEEARRQEQQREAAEKKKASSMTLKWANKQESGSSVKSLLQIQAEEEKEIKKRQTRELQENKGNNNNTGTNSGSGRLWGANNQPLSWASRASCNSAPPLSLPNGTPGGKSWSENSGGGSAWSGAAASLGSGFWDTAGSDKSGGRTAAAVAAARAPAKPGVVKGSQVQLQSAAVKQNKNTIKQNLNNKLNTQSNANNAAKVNSKKKGKEEETVKKIFSENVGGPDNEFTDWCSSTLVKLKVTASIDVPTFISFLRDVESPYEVHDYIRSYLGDNAEVREFARGYLERRSEVLNATRQKNLAHDNILGPAPAINPASDAFQEAKKGKQKGKKKVQKVDSGLLGFTIGGKGGDGNTAQ